MEDKTNSITKTKDSSRDLLTLIDPLCEKTIRDTILETFPTHDFLGEEDVPPGKEASAIAIENKLQNLLVSPSSSSPSSESSSSSSQNRYLWIVDPIDGTTNFVNGIPLCMPSIAVADSSGQICVGVIHDPHRNETYTAIRGRGTYLNGVRIHCRRTSSSGDSESDDVLLGDAIIAMGSPPAIESMQMSLVALPVLMPRVRTIRMLGSAALMLAWVAHGRLTAYWEYDLSSWDVAAGSILIEEAGGRMTDLNNERWNLRTRKICGSVGGSVHDEILDVLREAGVI
jgi:myo-inositol-1(or 4)-monophosphatase